MAVDGLRQALGDRYTIERELGRGGMATVYLATDVKVGRSVAIKVLHPELAAALGGERFHREIQIASRLTHPNILPVHDSGEADGTLYYVMPFVQGESLRDRLDRERQLSIDEALRITCQVASALEHAHSSSIVHRDIKPENILLEAGQAVLADFGIARAVTSAADAEALTRTGMSLGTPAYMSPEQAMGERSLDGRSDQYALACVTYEMLAGQPPFTAPTMQALIARHIAEQVPLITTVRPSVPEDLQDVILQALEKVPADRFPTIGRFAEALADAGTMTMTATTRRATPPRSMRYTTRTNRIAARPEGSRWRRAALIAAMAVPIVAGAGYSAQRLLDTGHVGSADGDFGANRIGVLYFTDESKDGGLRYLADGLTESLIDQLSAIPALEVVSRNGVLPFRGAELSSDSIGRALGVGSLVRGGIEPTGKGVKVSVRLVDAATGDDVERGRFEVASTDLAKATTQLATQVAEFLRARIGREVILRERRREASSVTAWLLVQRAEKRRKDADSLLAAGSTSAALSALVDADSMLAGAQNVDRDWATPPTLRAGVALARAQALRADPPRAAPAIDSGLAFAESALVADPRSADAHQYKGQLLYLRFTQGLIADPRQSDRALVAAESSLVRSVTINSNQAEAWATLSGLHFRKPDLQAASIAALNAYRADAYLSSARLVLLRLFQAAYNLEQFPEAMKWCNEARRRFAQDPFASECRLLMYMSRYGTPDPDSAWTYAERYAQSFPEAARERSRKKAEIFVAGALVRASLPDSARRVLDRIRATPELDPRRELTGYQAVVRSMLGDHDAAVRLIQDYLTVNPEHARGFAARTGWWWRDIQANPKFKAFIAALR